MSKQITEHQINECNQAITITADEPDAKYGNASHEYAVRVLSGTPCLKEGDGKPMLVAEHNLVFQRGPIKEVGTNGLTHEVLLAILIDRLRGFQSGAFACDENHRALLHLMEARGALFERTIKRVERGVEGTNVV